MGQSEQGDAGKRAPASTPQLADVAKPCARPTLHRFPVPLAPAPRLLAAQDYLSSPNPRAPGLRLLRSASSHRQSRSNRPLRSRTPVLPPRSLAPAAIAISLLGAAPAAGSSLGDRRQTLLAQRLVAPHTSQPLQARTAPGPHHPRTILPGVPALTCTLRRRGHRLALWCAAPGFVRRPGRRQSPLLRSPPQRAADSSRASRRRPRRGRALVEGQRDRSPRRVLAALRWGSPLRCAAGLEGAAAARPVPGTLPRTSPRAASRVAGGAARGAGTRRRSLWPPWGRSHLRGRGERLSDHNLTNEESTLRKKVERRTGKE